MNLATALQRTKRRGNSPLVVTDRILLKGGLNLVDSADQVSPGECIAIMNYEPYYINGAYRRVAGFERFDGRPRPHEAEYWKVSLQSIAGGPYTVGETVTASPSGETATVARYVVSGAADDTGYIIITDLSADVDEGEVWTGGSSSATATATSITDFQGEPEDEPDEHDTSQLAAESIRRDAITAVGGASASGPTRGVWVYNNEVYAFRNNAAGTAGTMWKATSSGWSQVDLGVKVRFENGATEIMEGDSVSGSTSGASCTARRIVVTDGYWSAGDASGYFVTDAVTAGPFSTGENLQVSAATVATADGTTAQESQTLPAGGAYRFRNYNFKGHTSTYRMYGVNGVGNAFEFDGSTFVLIETGMDDDTPTHIGVHRYHLLLAFTGGSLQHSGYQQPLSWQSYTGANEHMTGDEITGMLEEIGDVTFVFTRNQTYRLTGFVRENMQLQLHNYETGAFANSVQRLGRSIYLDDVGFTTLAATDAFGDFASSGISSKIEPLLASYRRETQVNASVINRAKSLYRCFFDNGIAIVLGFTGNRPNGFTLMDYGKTVTCACSNSIEAAGNNGEERVFFGDDDGFVYEADVGRNFDGEVVESYVVTHYHFGGNPEVNKVFRDAVIYMEGQSRTTIEVSADYNYNEDEANFETLLNDPKTLGGGRWGISRWGNFVYSSQSKTDVRVTMSSHGRNVSFIFHHEEANEEPHILYSLQLHWSPRRVVRSGR